MFNNIDQSSINKHTSKDQAHLFEVAKTVAANDEEISTYIQTFGLEDQNHLFEVAKIAAAKRGWKTSFHIKNYGIKDQNHLFEIAKIAAVNHKYGYSYSFFPIEDYGLTNPIHLFEIAKITAAKSGWGTSFHIKTYGIKDQNQLFEVAKIAAANNDGHSPLPVEKYGLTSRAHLFEVAKISAAHDQGDKYLRIELYGLRNRNQLFEVAKIAAAQDGWRTSSHIKDYGLRDQNQLFEIAKIAAANNGSTSMDIKKYGLKDQNQLFEIAKIAAKAHGSVVVEGIKNYGLQDKAQLFEVAKIAAVSSIRILIFDHLKDFEIQDKNQIFEIAKEVAEKCPSNLLGNVHAIQKLELNQDHLFEIAKMTAAQNGWISKDVQAYGFKNQSLIFEIARIALKIPPEKFEERKKELSEPSLIKALEKLLNSTQRYDLTRLLFEQLFEVNGRPDLYYILGTRSFAKKYPLFRLLLTPLLEGHEASDEIFSILYRWDSVFATLNAPTYKNAPVKLSVINSLYTLVKEQGLSKEAKADLMVAVFKTGENKETIKERANEVNRNLGLIQGIIDLHKVNELNKIIGNIFYDRFPSGTALRECMHNIVQDLVGDIKVQDFYNKFDKSFLQARQPNAFFIYSCRLLGQTTTSPKERNAFLPHLRALYTAILEGNLSDVRYATKPGDHLSTIFNWNGTIKTTWTRPQTIPLKQNAEPLIQKPIDTSLNVMRYLYEKIIQDQHIDVNEYPILFKCLKSLNLKSIDSVETYLKQLESNAQPKEESQNLKVQMQKQLIALIDPSKNTKDRMPILCNAIDSLKKILQPDHQFLKDLENLRKEMQAEGRPPSQEKLEAKDSDDWEDLLLCGTEVGSCQSIYASTHYNRCLLNYILDGKNRIVVLKDSKGIIHARAILRLLWDQTSQRPVLFRERLYKLPGVSEMQIQSLYDLCLAKAKAMSIALVRSPSYDFVEKDLGNYPYDLMSMNGQAPFEYVDADDLTITYGNFKISAKSTMMIYDGKR